ncbi:toxin-antitoxin system protein [Prevotella sp. A2931]|uniref:Toxin-antitoxin system protein n=1 Tax=Prevotella illustrans TaxID=2800387 RepID=A0ABS3M324_9BACT|nr:MULTISPECIES: toxin-antitoxin system protein [Prevotella]MBO1362554.1 toxin-antitoxin system protein [Prevotella illustrans]PTL26723.1 toxin-antitoxin system protein [Prevotella sp. oral taxon 820]
MTNYKVNIFFIALMLLFTACDSVGKDGRFTGEPMSHVTAPEAGVLDRQKQSLWNFDTMEGWTVANQGNDTENHSSIESNTQCEDGKALRIYTSANTQQRKKVRTVKQYSAGLYTWRTYISDLGEVERTSIGSWLWHDDKHELDFEVGSGTAAERLALGLAADEVIAYITSQDNPWLQQKVGIKKNAWHEFQIDLKLVGKKYFATWLIDKHPYAMQQLAYGEEVPFYIFCSTENLKFIGDTWPYQTNYGLWDYVSYIPYSYSSDSVTPEKPVDPVDPAPEPDEGETKRWTFDRMPDGWKVWTNVGADGVGYYGVSDGRLLLSNDGYCITSKIEYSTPVGFGKYIWKLRFPRLAGAEKFMAGGTLYTANEANGPHTLTIVGWYGSDAERSRLGAQSGDLLLRIYSEIPALDRNVKVLKPETDYKLSIELKKVNGKYVIVYAIDDEVIQTLPANYGADVVKFLFIASAESNRGWMPGNPLTGKYTANFDYIEYTAY